MKTAKIILGTGALFCASLMYTTKARGEVTDADKAFLAHAAQADIDEIKVSELAESKATDPRVKAFAHTMVTQHTKLETQMKPFAEAWGLTPPSGPDPEHQAELDKLNGLSGAEFDKEYMSAMDKDHHKALEDFTNEVNSTTDAKFKTAVMHGKSMVAAHTNMADSLQGKVS